MAIAMPPKQPAPPIVICVPKVIPAPNRHSRESGNPQRHSTTNPDSPKPPSKRDVEMSKTIATIATLFTVLILAAGCSTDAAPSECVQAAENAGVPNAVV